MRVLRLITSVEPEFGGPPISTVESASAECRAGRSVTLAFSRPTRRIGSSAVPMRRLRDEGVDMRPFRRLPVGPVAQKWALSPGLVLFVLTRARRYDVLHVDYFWTAATAAAIVAGRLWGKPVICTPHESLTGRDIDVSRSPARIRQKEIVRRALIKRLQAVVCCSYLELEDSRIERGQGVMVPYPVPPDEPRGIVAQAPETGLDVGFVGRLHEKKRVDLLLEHVAALPEDVRLHLAGGHPPAELERLKARAGELGLGDRAKFYGFVVPEQRAAFLAGIHVLALPSLYESFAIVAAEAMYAGKPIVATDRTGVGHWVREAEAGFVVDVDDIQGFRDALERLRTDRALRDRMGAAARTVAYESFTPAAYAERMGEVYARVGVVGDAA